MISLKALTEKKNSQTIVLSPSVGQYSLAPKPDTFLSPSAFIGKLTIINSDIDLYLPADIFGKVIIEDERDKIIQVEYKQELFRLNPEKLQSNNELKQVAAKAKDETDLADGFVVKASTTGIFYRRPSPDAPSYVEQGESIEKGKVLGLIEVMKTFNHIVFQGTDNSDSGVVKKVLCEDAQEVKLGEGLFVVE